MIRKPEVSRDYHRMNPLAQALLGTNVTNGLNNNPGVFIPTDLPVSIADLAAATNNLLTKYNEYKQQPGGKGDFELAQLQWLTKIDLTADYVELVANEAGEGAKSVILLSKFHVTKTETEPATLPVSPVAEMSISNIQRGKVAVNVKPLKGTKAFVYSMATPGFQFNVINNQITIKIGNEFASFIFTTEREVMFQNLPATEVTAAVAAINTAGLGTFSTVTDVKIP